jgi:S-formylglutathione hydrolase
LEKISENRCFGGVQGFYRHVGSVQWRDAFLPFTARRRPGRSQYRFCTTCRADLHRRDFTIKAGAQRVASELGLMLVMPDTSPRNTEIQESPTTSSSATPPASTSTPRRSRTRNSSTCIPMSPQVPRFIAANFPGNMARQSIFGHSMGGHGALTIALKNPDRYRSVSAFSPMVAPMRPLGREGISALPRHRSRNLAAVRCL